VGVHILDVAYVFMLMASNMQGCVGCEATTVTIKHNANHVVYTLAIIKTYFDRLPCGLGIHGLA
jgi:hypothetical protein